MQSKEMISAYFMVTWTCHNGSVCTIAIFLEALVFSLHLSVSKTKVCGEMERF
jgi:hypothetical protein